MGATIKALEWTAAETPRASIYLTGQIFTLDSAVILTLALMRGV